MTNDSPTSASEHETPHYPVSPPVRRQLQACYERGTQLVSDEKYDFDYAHTMFSQCVIRDPNNLVYVEAMLENLQRKFKNNKRGSRLLSFGGQRSALKKAIAREDWAEVLKLGPDLLQSNPWDVMTLRAMAQACAAYHYNEVELRYLKNALEANPKDPEVSKHCALSLARMGQFDQAIACWHRVEEVRRHDPEAAKMISELTIEKTRIGGGFGNEVAGPRPAAASPAAVRDQRTETETEAEAPKRREIELTPRQKLEHAIVEFPTELENYFQLAQMHVDQQRYGDAEHVLNKALAASGGELQVQERLEDARILRMRHQLAVAEKRAEVKQSDEARQLAEEIRSNLHRLELQVLHSRTERYPQNEELKCQLGKRLKRLGKFREAVELLQQVTDDSPLTAVARLEQGECLQHLKEYPKALLAYQQAIAAAEGPTLIEARKLSLYRGGILSAGLRQLDVAERLLGELVELESSYKDAAERLDKIRQVRHKE